MKNHGLAYAKDIEVVLDKYHQPEFEYLWSTPTCEGEWTGRFQVTQSLAFLFAVVYHFTGKTEYLESAKRYLLDFDRGYHFMSLFCGRTFDLIKSHLSAAEQSDFERRWVADAQSQLGKYIWGSEPDREERIKSMPSISNHRLCASVYADYARKLFPDEAKAYHLEKITNLVWDIFWTQREFQEQASNYEGFSECFLCAWAELRNVKQEFYASPSIRNMLARNERVVSPSGIVTAYGDSGHNEHTSAWIALFERVACDTGEGQWKQTAWDIFLNQQKLNYLNAMSEDKLQRLNIYKAREVYAACLQSFSWLAMAALWSDSELQPEPRTNFSGVNRRLPIGHRLTNQEKKTRIETPLLTCQVALTGGSPDPEKRTYLLLSVGPQLRHDHSDAGAILMLSQGNCCLLGTNGYLQHELLYHNTFYAQPKEWPVYPEDAHDKIINGDSECHGNLEKLLIEDDRSYCCLYFESYHKLPISLRREIILDTDGAVILIDHVTPKEDGWCGGILFHAEKIRKVSPKTFLLRIDILRSMQGMEESNSGGELLVEFICPTAEINVSKKGIPAVYTDEPGYQTFPCIHYTKIWQRSYTARKCLSSIYELKKGKEVIFITRMTPRNT